MTRSNSRPVKHQTMRKTHKKSRNGCRSCKARRVKCDEHGPPCAACVIRGLDCDFETSAQIPTDDAVLYSTHRYDGNNAIDTDPQRIGSTTSTPSAVPPSSGQSTVETPSKIFHLQDLELMHHFTAHTYKTISVVGVTDDVWQTFVPREALKYEYLMHGVLGLAALHMVDQIHDHTPDKRREKYLQLTSYHQERAFALFRSVLDRSIDRENCHSIFAFSVMAMVFAIGSPDLTSETKGLDGVFVLFDFLQGVATVAAVGWQEISQGPFGMFLDIDGRIPLDDLDDNDRHTLAHLRRLNHTLLAVVDPTAHTALASAVGLLEKAWRGGDLLVLAWLAMCGRYYMALLRQGQRMAQLVFLHWLVLLHRLSRLWWVKDSAVSLVETMAPELRILGPDWSDAVDGVRRRVGMSGTA